MGTDGNVTDFYLYDDDGFNTTDSSYEVGDGVTEDWDPDYVAEQIELEGRADENSATETSAPSQETSAAPPEIPPQIDVDVDVDPSVSSEIPMDDSSSPRRFIVSAA